MTTSFTPPDSYQPFASPEIKIADPLDSNVLFSMITFPGLVTNIPRARLLPKKLLFITDIGLYPVAQHHFLERAVGAKQNILIYCTYGKGWVEIDGNKRKVQKDQFFIIPANIPHKYGADFFEPWTIYWIHFTGEMAERFVKEDFLIIPIDPVKNTGNDRRIRLFEEIYQNLSMGYSTENLEYSSICLWYFLGAFNYVPQFERIRAVQLHDFIEKSILYMSEHIEGKINLTDLANLCGFSVSHYSMIFKKKTSRSPMEYYNNLKIQKASQMLDFTSLHIKEIATGLTLKINFISQGSLRRKWACHPLIIGRRKRVDVQKYQNGPLHIAAHSDNY